MKLVELVNVLKVKFEWLSFGEGVMFFIGQDEVILLFDQWGIVEFWDNLILLFDDEVEVLFLKDIELVCGDGMFFCEDYNGYKFCFLKVILC